MAICCGCHFQDDYGTSTVSGVGSQEDPFTYTQVDPSFQRPVVRAFVEDAQVIPDGVPTAIIFEDEEFDTDGMWDAGNPTRLTFQLDGFYLIGAHYGWFDVSSGTREFFFRANGVTDLHRQSQFRLPTIDRDFSLAYNWYFTEGEYVELVAFQTDGDSTHGNLEFPLSFWAIYLGKRQF